MTPTLLYVTTTSKEEALKIGRVLLEKRLIACLNTWEGMTSLYWWEGKIEEARECVLLLKTTSDKVDAVTSLVKAMHSYSVPCVVSWPIEKGNPDYLNWLREQVKS